jgi:hypothetical protein
MEDAYTGSMTMRGVAVTSTNDCRFCRFYGHVLDVLTEREFHVLRAISGDLFSSAWDSLYNAAHKDLAHHHHMAWTTYELFIGRRDAHFSDRDAIIRHIIRCEAATVMRDLFTKHDAHVWLETFEWNNDTLFQILETKNVDMLRVFYDTRHFWYRFRDKKTIERTDPVKVANSCAPFDSHLLMIPIRKGDARSFEFIHTHGARWTKRCHHSALERACGENDLSTSRIEESIKIVEYMNDNKTDEDKNCTCDFCMADTKKRTELKQK